MTEKTALATTERVGQIIEQGFSERGNTLLIGEETGRVVFYRRIDAERVFKFAYIPESYPSIDAGIVRLDQAAQIREITDCFAGLTVIKTELDLPQDD